MNIPTARAVALLPLLSVAACGPADTAPMLTTSRDSAGITIVENVQPGAPRVPVWNYEPVLDIGDVGGAGPDAFYRVAGAVWLGDGRIAVADGSSAELRFFDEAGAFLGAVGRRGGGPGEFFDIAVLQRGPSDSLYVFDGKAQRITVLAGDGTFGRELTIFPGAGPGELAGRLSDGSWIARTSDLPPKLDIRPGLGRWPVHIVRLPPAGREPDTIGSFPGREMFFRFVQKGFMSAAPPFGRALRLALAGDRLWVSTSEEPELLQYDGEGRLLRIIRTGHQPRPITSDLLAAFVADRAARLPALKRPADVPAEQVIRQSIEGVPTPPTLPAYGSLVAGVDGELWVSDFHDPVAPSGGWTVYGPDGGIRARVRLADGFRLLDVGADVLLGTLLDDLDVEHVRLYRRH